MTPFWIDPSPFLRDDLEKLLVTVLKVAVTGGAGYIGSLLVKRLMDQGYGVVSVDNLMRGDYSYLRRVGAHEGAELVEGDIRDSKLLESLFKNIDAIVHLAALSDLVPCRERPEEAISINIFGTHQVLETARKLDIGKIVFGSSAAVYGKPQQLPINEFHPLHPLNLYGVTKLAGEKLMDAYHDVYGIETINLRLGNAFGIGLYTNYDAVIPKFIRLGLEGKPLTIYGDGDSSRDYVHVENIVQAVVLSLNAKGLGGEVFNVGGETIKTKALVTLISDLLKKIKGINTSVIHLPPRSGETKYFSYDLDKIKKGLGYKAIWGIEEGIEQIIKYKLEEMKFED